MLLDSLKFDQHHEILKWLEHTNPSRNHNRAHELHEEHTGVWTLRSQEWKDWLERRTRCLWIHGIPGAGKTVLASYLIEQLKAKFMDTSGVGYAYYYCYFARKQDEAGPFLRWVISQLCRRARRVPSRLVSLHQQGCEPGFPELLACLEASLEVFDVAYITVDAVDESMPYRSLLNILRTLGSDDRFRKIQLLVTSREYLDIERILLDFAVPMAMSNSLVDQDIQHYVRSELASNRKFSAWPESARTEIEEALTKGAKGMFRWVICQLDILERLKTPSAVTRALHDLPETLDETYERILSSIPTQHRRFARRAFAILCAHADVHISDEDPICAEVLLSAIVSGMREETGNGHFYVCDTIREVCGCLVSITQDPLGGKEVALLAHYTVKEFLYSERIFNSRVDGVDFFALNDRIVRTEFAEMVFKGATEAEESQETGQPDIFSDFQDYCLAYGAIIIRKWDLLLTRCSSLYELAFRFLSPSQSHFTRLLRIEATISDAISDDEFEPLVLQWESVANNESMILGNLLWYHAWNLAETFVVEKDLKSIPFEHLSCAEYRCAGQANTHGSLLTILARLGNHYSILPFLKLVDILYRKLDKSTLLLCCTAIHYHNDCHRSSEYGCILEWLIDHGADPNSTLFGLTPLQIAIARLDYEGAKLLLTEGANPNAIGTPAGLMPSGIHTIKTNASPLHIIRSGAYEVEAIDDFVDLHSPYTTEPKATVEELLLGFGARDFVRPTQMMMEFLLGPGP
ncbi:hypothetical protein BKA64DRAFT_565057 [Cadophora sp. MPI-SDFR-AT-0126]|nr:hypothetical protein BKA64DRAFT_565057 [Leotiomycetes sp. MPI-SDFR-AT-0126]